ncbi:MAG: RNHCP domain-containing protein [Candidatus Andersenbacteria bacterium]|nr:RNHCP domain-containing protein [bacterium]MDZ4225288.1 RNHCP domain-containing protein [Candidatus Andersenbacteria bacterium]
MGFIPLNEGFTCQQCGQEIPPAPGTFRNHCPICLTSKHVDQNIPGDRQANCLGLMPAQSAQGTDPDKLDIIHRCIKCGKKIVNRRAPDDNTDLLINLTANPH